MSVHIKVKFDGNKRMLEDRLKFAKCKRKLISQIIKDTTPYVPYQEGTLYQSAITNQSRYKDKIVWNGPYARFLYNGLVMIGVRSKSAWAKRGEVKQTIQKVLHYGKKHPLAGYKWYERSKAHNKAKWVKLTKEWYKRG